MSSDSAPVNILRWFFGGERYRLNIAIFGGRAAGAATGGWETVVFGMAFSLLTLVWFPRR